MRWERGRLAPCPSHPSNSLTILFFMWNSIHGDWDKKGGKFRHISSTPNSTFFFDIILSKTNQRIIIKKIENIHGTGRKKKYHISNLPLGKECITNYMICPNILLIRI